MRLIFMGTSTFAAPSLRALVKAGHEVMGVWIRVDKPHGRGHHVDFSPVKQAAIELGLPVYQPATLKRPETAADVAALSPDVICVAAYGLILPPTVLQAARLGCVNVHASLLPHYRGAAPIHRAIMAGETVTGITTMMMDEGLDTGDALLRAEIPIGPDDTYGEIHDLLAEIGARLLLQTLERLEEGSLQRHPQDSSQASYAPPVRKEECEIDWRRPAAEIHNLVRGANPRPGAFSFRGGEMLRIHRTHPLPPEEARAIHTEVGGAGALVRLPGRRGPAVLCGSGMLELCQVQPAGKKSMSGFDYTLGRPILPGETLIGAKKEGKP